LIAISVLNCIFPSADFISDSVESRFVFGFSFYFLRSTLKIKGFTGLFAALILWEILSFLGEEVSDSLSNSMYSVSLALFEIKNPKKEMANRTAKSRQYLASWGLLLRSLESKN
jgi:hypothetical protein